MTEVIARPVDAPEALPERYDTPQVAAMLQGYAVAVIDRVFADLAAPRPGQVQGAEVLALFAPADDGTDFVTILLRHIAANADRLLTARTDHPDKPNGLENVWSELFGELEGHCTEDVNEAFGTAEAHTRFHGRARVFTSIFGGAR